MKSWINIKTLFFFLLLSASLISSCGSNKDKIPLGIIPQDSMIVILANVHLAESRLMLHGKINGDEKLKASYMQHVLSASQTDTARFNKSFAFYVSKPELFTNMYDKVMAEISKRQAEKK